MTRTQKGTLLVVLSAMSFGIMPLLVTRIYAYGCSAATLLFFRQLLPLPLFLWLSRGELGRTLRERGTKLAAASLFSAVITPLLLLNSYLYIASGMATTLHFVYPMFVFVIETLFFRKPFRAAKLLCYMFCAAGVGLLQGGSSAGNPLGVAIALLSGVTYAVFIVMLERADVGSYSPYAVNTVVLMVSCVAVFFYGAATHSLTFDLPLRAYGLIFILAMLIAIVGSMFFQIGVSCIGGQKAALFSCLEPITSVFCGVLVLREGLTLRAVIGTAVILAAITASVLLDAKKSSVKNRGKSKIHFCEN